MGSIHDFYWHRLQKRLNEMAHELTKGPFASFRVKECCPPSVNAYRCRDAILVCDRLEIERIQAKLQKDVSSRITDMQRRAYLREQLKAIQKELGEEDQGVEEQIEHLRKKLADAKPPQAALEAAERELKRLAYVPPASAEFPIIVSYVEIIAELLWSQLSEDNLDLKRVKFLPVSHVDEVLELALERGGRTARVKRPRTA